jgi:hypothetical protein
MKYTDLITEHINKDTGSDLVPVSAEMFDVLVQDINSHINDYIVNAQYKFNEWEEQINDILLQTTLEPAGHPGKPQQKNIVKSIEKQVNKISKRIRRMKDFIIDPPFKNIVVGDVLTAELNKSNILIEGIDTSNCPGIAVAKLKAQLPYILDENKKKYVENVVKFYTKLSEKIDTRT